MIRSIILAAAIMSSGSAVACNYTAVPGENVQSLLNSSAIQTLCLSPGIYQLYSMLEVPAGKWLKGTGASRDDVKLISNADKIVYLRNNTRIHNLAIEGRAGSLPTYGVLSYHGADQLIWGIRVKRTLISIGINGSSRVTVADTFTSLNGNLSNGKADPNLWVSSSTDITIDWGAYTGRGNYPGGDGEIAAYDSVNVNIYGTHVLSSGASAIYLVNCDYCSVENATIQNAGEWGLDVVRGSDYFIAKGNSISYSRWGGSVFDEAGSLGGSYQNNRFISNNQSGYAPYCNGINVQGSPSGFTNSGNYVNTGLLICTPWN